MLSSDACCGCHFLGQVSVSAFSLTLPTVLMLALVTCLSSPSCVRSTIPILSLPDRTWSPVLKCLVNMSDGFLSPRTFPHDYRLGFDKFLHVQMRYSHMPHLSYSHLELSHQILGVSTTGPKSSSQRFLRNTVSLAH